VGHLQVVT